MSMYIFVHAYCSPENTRGTAHAWRAGAETAGQSGGAGGRTWRWDRSKLGSNGIASLELVKGLARRVL